MPRFKYVAVAPDGSQVKGDAESPNEDTLRNELLMRNLEVTLIRSRGRKLTQIDVTPQRVPAVEIMHFSRQMAAFVRSGIPVVDGIEVVAEGTSNKRFRKILLDLREAIATGVPFSEALAVHSEVLPPYYLGIIRSAELTGKLDTALEQLSLYIERDLETRNKIKAAIMYPAVVLAMSAITVLVLTVWVLPKFADFFDGLNAELPLSTRMLISIANFTKNYWWVYLIAFAAIVGFCFFLATQQAGKRIRDRALLHIPVISQVVLYSVVERLCRILGAMSKAAVPLPDAMLAAMQGANNTVFVQGLTEARDRMLEGEGLAEPLADTELFPRAAVQMMRVGEDTGTLDNQLESAADFYSHELEYKLKRLTTLFEPIVLVVMGVVVGFVAIALVQAMYGIYSSPASNNLK